MRSPWIALLCLVACRDGSPPNEQPARRPAEEAPRERVFTPSPAQVRSVGPYAITASGVGLYALGSDLRAVLAMLPSNAPVDTLEIEGIVKYKVVPPDAQRILVGFESSGKAAFIAVVAPDIAMVDGSFGVGTTIEEVRAGLGPDVMDRSVRDPHLLILSKLPNARFVTDEERITAIVVTPEERRPAPPRTEAAAEPSACDRGAEILAGSLPEPHGEEDAARASYGCFTGATPEIALAEGDEVVVYGGEPGRLRRTTAASVPGLVFAGALDVDRDGRSEIVSVAERRSSDALAARIVVWRGEAGRLVEVGDKEVYRMTSGSAGWIGAKLKDVSFVIEVLPDSTSSVEVHGLYVQRGDDQEIHTVAPLMTETMAVRPRRTATTPGGAGAPATPAGAGATPVKPPDGGAGKGGAGDHKDGKPGAGKEAKEAGKEAKEAGKEGKKPASPPRKGPATGGGAKRDASDM